MKAFKSLFIMSALLITMFFLGVWTMTHGYGVEVKSWGALILGSVASMVAAISIHFIADLS